MVTFSESHLSNIKALLFGQQKQASVINDAVVKLVARELSSTFGIDDTLDIDDAHAKIMSYLFACVNGGVTYTDDTLMLIVGEVGLANLKSGEDVVVSESDASETSTKKYYRINVKGADAAVDNTGELGTGSLRGGSTAPEAVTPTNVDRNADFWTQAQQLKAAIQPLVSDAVKAEIPNDEFAQCLVCAEQYFNYKN